MKRPSSISADRIARVQRPAGVTPARAYGSNSSFETAPAPKADTSGMWKVLIGGPLSLITVVSLFAIMQWEHSAATSYDEKLANAPCVMVSSPAGSDTIPVPNKELTRSIEFSRNGVRFYPTSCLPDECMGEALQSYHYGLSKYLMVRMGALNSMHRQYGPEGVQFMQKEFDTPIDQQIFRHARLMKKAGKLKERSIPPERRAYLNLLIESGGKPVKVCYVGKQSRGGGMNLMGTFQ
jgi:hypothetical protein